MSSLRYVFIPNGNDSYTIFIKPCTTFSSTACSLFTLALVYTGTRLFMGLWIPYADFIGPGMQEFSFLMSYTKASRHLVCQLIMISCWSTAVCAHTYVPDRGMYTYNHNYIIQPNKWCESNRDSLTTVVPPNKC